MLRGVPLEETTRGDRREAHVGVEQFRGLLVDVLEEEEEEEEAEEPGRVPGDEFEMLR